MTEKYPVVKGAEPFYHEGGKVGILVSHGFTGTTQSMRPLAEAYAEQGYTVCAPRLKGHGTHHEDMEATTYQDWISSIEEAYYWLKELCDVIFVTGLSMGGTLTLYMAEKYPEIKAIVPINAAVDLPEMAGVMNLEGVRFLDAIGSDIKNPEIQELAYEQTPVESVKEIIKLMEKVKGDLSKITCPALIFVSSEDHVVPPGNSQIIFEQIGSDAKEIVTLENSYHVATLDYDKGLIIEKSLEFFNKNLK